MYRLIQLIIYFILTSVASAQIMPGEGDILNYRLAGFSIPIEKKADKYQFEISEYTASDNGDILRNTAIQTSDSNRTIFLLPEFDKQYIWRVVYLNSKNKSFKQSPYYHFSTGKYPTVDSQAYRLRIIDSAKHHEDIYVIVDNISVIYNLKGEPVWCLPEVSLKQRKDLQMRCIKPTTDGTFTAVGDLEAFEFDYRGNIVWQAPNDGKISGNEKEHYHHEMTKLDNGNYLIAGFQYTMEKAPANYKLKPGMIKPGKVEKRTDGYYRVTKSDNLIEYNKQKQPVWHWKSLEHFDLADFFRRSPKGVNIEMHMNSFFVDKEHTAIYISYRNKNEIIKIGYPSGTVLNTYGSALTNDNGYSRLFYGQHNVTKGPDGRIRVFNNNASNHIRKDPELHRLSHVEIYDEHPKENSLTKTWTFPCNIDTETAWYGTGGGGVTLLEDGCMLVSTGSASRAFIVNAQKEIIWNAVVETSNSGSWKPLGPYRVNYITKQQLEEFVFK